MSVVTDVFRGGHEAAGRVQPLPWFDTAAKGPCPVCAGWGVIEATDIFCGAGGSSLGLEFVCCPACGRSLIQVTQAINHWDLAVQAHNANFPHADHDVHEAAEIPAGRFRRTDILWASPECTHHAYCRGPKDMTEEAMRSRATFKDVVRFTAHHRYDAVIVENVVEARLWCDEPGHREKCNCGATFTAWHLAMTELGYVGRIVYFNSQFALPTPQSRDRMYVVFTRVGIPEPNLDFSPPSWCSGCAAVVQGIQTWKKPSPKGLRTQDGLFEWGRYGPQYLYRCPVCTEPVAPAVTGAITMINWQLPMERIGDRSKDLAPNTRERIRTGLQDEGRMEPLQVQVGGHLYTRPGSKARVWSMREPLRTVTQTPTMGLVTPAGGQKAAARALGEPSHTIVGNDRLAVTLRVGGQSAAPAPVGAPSTTITAHDRQRAVVVAGKSDTVPRAVNEPAPAITTRAHQAVVVPNMTNNAGRSIEEPIGAVTTGNRQMLVAEDAAIVPLRNHASPQAVGEPIPAVTGGGYHHGLLVYNGVPGFVRSLEDAGGTVTARDKQSLLVPYYTNGKARSTEMPACTLSTRDREALVVTDAEIDDCYFRMLKWPELLRAQVMHALPDGTAYALTAQRRNHRGKLVELSDELRVKMIGNAVSSPVATMLGWSVVIALSDTHNWGLTA